MISRIAILTSSLICLSSCSDEQLYQTFELGEKGAVIRAYRDASGFATTTPQIRLELYSPDDGASKQVLQGLEPRKLDIRLDDTAHVLLIYFCGGQLGEVESLVDIDGQTTIVQPIISDFESDASNSSGCEGVSFYSVTGS